MGQRLPTSVPPILVLLIPPVSNPWRSDGLTVGCIQILWVESTIVLSSSLLGIPFYKEVFYAVPLSLLRDLLTEKFHALLQETFQEKLQERIDQTEANSSPSCADCKKKRPSKTKNRKQ